MASNSVRVGAALFAAAQERGELMSRSAAQQIEHWARLGAALEATGLSVANLAHLLSGTLVQPESDTEQALWAFKRGTQARDLLNVQEGRLAASQMSWFAGGTARAARLVDSPY